jgi:AcrR family transcriptional regulator
MREAAQLFARYGFAGASLSDLAKKCDVSKSVLYHYFASKEDILYAVMETHMDALLEAIDLELYMAIPENMWFRELSRQLLKRYSGASNSQKVLLYDLDYLNPGDRKKIVVSERRLVQFAERCLLQAVAPAEPDPRVLKAQVMLFFGMINWSHSWFSSKRGISREELADQAANTAALPLKI